MGRAEYRRQKKIEKANKATYIMTQEQINDMKKEITEDAINTAMILLLTLPMEVLMDHYWTKTYAKKIPEFTDHVLEYYRRWQDGEIKLEDLQKDLWEYGGVRLEKGK